jgi:hypothetical protein
VREGSDLSVNLVGKVATWILYASVALMLVTSEGTDFPYVFFLIGLGLAMVAGAMYVVSAVRRPA